MAQLMHQRLGQPVVRRVRAVGDHEIAALGRECAEAARGTARARDAVSRRGDGVVEDRAAATGVEPVRLGLDGVDDRPIMVAIARVAGYCSIFRPIDYRINLCWKIRLQYWCRVREHASFRTN